MLLLLVAVGGFLGAVGRYRLTAAVNNRARGRFPWGTLAVNLSGSAALGVVASALMAGDAESALGTMVAVGVLGSFTTFSSFAYEATALVQEGRRGLAGMYVAASLLLGLACVAWGLAVGRVLAGG